MAGLKLKTENVKYISFGKIIAYITSSILLFTSCGKHNLDLESLGKIATLTVTANIQAGKYSSPPSFELTLSKSEPSSEIYYCVNAGVPNAQFCCDPLIEGVGVKGANASGTAGSTDGKYCLAYIGFTADEISKVGKILFEIDTSGPDINILTQRRMIQSNQYVDISFSSTTIGEAGYFFSVLNYTTDQGTECDVINSSDNFTNFGIDFDKNASPDTIDLENLVTNFSQSLRGKDLVQYGDNYLYYAIVDTTTDPMLSSCPSLNIILNDFNVFEFSTNGDLVANGNGEFEAMGTFNSFGGGVKIGNSGKTKLQTGILNIIH